MSGELAGPALILLGLLLVAAAVLKVGDGLCLCIRESMGHLSRDAGNLRSSGERQLQEQKSCRERK